MREVIQDKVKEHMKRYKNVKMIKTSLFKGQYEKLRLTFGFRYKKKGV